MSIGKQLLCHAIVEQTLEANVNKFPSLAEQLQLTVTVKANISMFTVLVNTGVKIYG